jgi:hypothetical protein
VTPALFVVLAAGVLVLFAGVEVLAAAPPEVVLSLLLPHAARTAAVSASANASATMRTPVRVFWLAKCMAPLSSFRKWTRRRPSCDLGVICTLLGKVSRDLR